MVSTQYFVPFTASERKQEPFTGKNTHAHFHMKRYIHNLL